MKKNNKKAFTLIELLIVIALLGALAVGLLAALDPFEQLKKGTDTSVRNLVQETHGAIIRYYALKSEMPWCNQGTCASDPSETTLTAFGTGDNNPVSRIINSGELKADFMNLAGNNTDKVFITGSAESTSVVVCMQPTSKSFQADNNTKFNKDGSLATGETCKSDGGNTNCFWCVQ